MKSLVNKPVPRPVTPLGILAQELEALVQALNKQTLPGEIQQKLDFVSRLASGLDPYLEQCTTSESAALKALADKTAREEWSNRFDKGETVIALEQEMLSGHIEGQTLKMFIYMTKAKRVLEIGMFTGYSALAMASALPADGKLIACEVDAYTAEFGKAAFRESPHGEKIQVEIGPARETLDKLAAAGESFDFVFIDADKAGYVDYFHILLEKNLLAPSGFICVDNTLLQGQPYLSEAERTANGKAIADFNRIVAADQRVEQVLLPVRDGLSIIRRLES
ncbi:class I SAM-dependent methyltransferase [Plectonema cf. radiosum LEGE 06105]|uniref:Class I SAM-dependent methyltransferase n=1 Tax=Plectonema cf. radiosum LEGE 06105 TaxID=945769 RepID=A0A8J7FJC3_9CYAN|nr:class I SAM-dependent methyltransferase [Plectonema radiosum]MBE9214871.1 class I SAM-dependent methyltransferase [Plectonema cf. radiosum LEGE 06105]